MSLVKQISSKKEKKKITKNSSFNGVEATKSPKNRRKSIAAVLPTPIKKKKVVKTASEWEVTENFCEKPAIKKEWLVESESKVVASTPKLKSPKKKSRKSNISSVVQKSTSINSIPTLQSGSNIVDEKKRKRAVKTETSHFEATSVEKFGIKSTVIAKAVEAAIKLHKENPKLQNQLFDDPISLSLQLSCHKLPQGPSRIIRIPLPNSILTPDDEVCLIVPEVKGIKNIEHEKHVEHYENLLRGKGVENIKKIMTFHEFRTEYETFEQKLRLADLYDMFLVDGRISGKVVHKCGKIFYKKKKVPTSVKLQATNLKSSIDKALSKAFFLLHLKGDSYNVKFGHDKMGIEALVENVFAVIEHLDKEFPGGFDNIKGLYISATRATSIPIYASLKNPNEIKLSQVKSKKPKAYKTYQGELSTLPDAEVIVKPTGKIFVKRIKQDEKL